MSDTKKTIVITGASDGIGAAAARNLKVNGHEVIVVGRNPEKTKAVADELGARSFTADFSSLADVARLAADLRDTVPRIDVLANNAGGLMGKNRTMTDDGHEVTFQVNVLAPFYLTQLLLPRLQESRATVINTSSLAHKVAKLDPQDLDAERSYSAGTAYGNAKLMNLLHAKELDRRYRERGVSSASFHPGVISSNFSQGSDSPMSWLYKTPAARLMPDSDAGADTLVWLAESTPGKDFGSGSYYVKRKPASITGPAQDSLLASRVWDALESITADLPS